MPGRRAAGRRSWRCCTPLLYRVRPDAPPRRTFQRRPDGPGTAPPAPPSPGRGTTPSQWSPCELDARWHAEHQATSTPPRGPVTIGRLSAVVPYVTNQDRRRIKYRSALSEDIWRAYESTQKHYDSDFNLFTNRMNLFLAVESVLITIATAAVVWQNATVPIRIQLAISAFGVLLSLAWLAAAISTYQWVRHIRDHLIQLGDQWELRSGVPLSIAAFSKDRRNEAKNGGDDIGIPVAHWFSWHVRPSYIICSLPILYAAGWIVLLLIGARPQS